MNSTDGTCPTRYRSRYGWSTCDRPVQGGTICPQCASDHAARLRVVPRLLVDLAAVIRGDETTSSAGPGARSEPGSRPPLDVGLLDARDDLTRTLATWTARITPRSTWPGVPFPYPQPAPTHPAAAALWLADHADHARTRPWAVDYVQDTDHAVAALDGVVNPHPSPIRVACPTCGTRVTIPPDPCDGTTRADGTPARCPGCVAIRCDGWIPAPSGARVRCEQWGIRSWWATAVGVEDEPTTIPLLPGVLLAHGYDIPTDTVRSWADRGRITPTGVDHAGRRLYDPAQVAAYAATRAATRRNVRPA